MSMSVDYTERDMPEPDIDSEDVMDAYAEWLCNSGEHLVWNRNRLVELMDAGAGWESFLETLKEA